jgi:hypothetical protein
MPDEEELLLEDLELGDAFAVCRVCGCDSLHACEGGCVWAAPDLCSRCVG